MEALRNTAAGVRTRALAIGGIALLFALALSACDESGDDLVIPDPAPPPRDTPKRLLTSFFPAVYHDRDSTAYADMLDDAFEFVFLPEDRDSAGLAPGEDSWGRGPDLHSTGNMFRAPRVLGIVLELTPVSDPTVVTGQPGQPAGEAWYQVITDADLRVTVGDPSGIDDTIFTVTNRQEFLIRPDLRAGHEGEWRLVLQRELDVLRRRAGRPDGVQTTSWGEVKSLFD